MKYLSATIALLCAITFTNAQWNSNTSVNLKAANLPATGIGAVGTNDGRTYITFYSSSAGKYFIRVQLLDQNGYKLFPDTGILLSEKGASSDTDYNSCADTGNNLIVGSQYDKAGIQTAIINKITANGSRPWGIDGVELGPGFIPSLIALTNGDILAAWNNGDAVNYQRIHPDGSLSWLSPKVISASGDSVSNSQLAAHTNNTFGIIYQQSFDISALTHLYEQRFDIDGNPIWANPVQLSNYGTGFFRHYGRPLSDNDITYMGYFGTSPGGVHNDAFLQRINGDGTLPWGINGAPFADYSTSTDPFEGKIEIAHDSGSSFVWATGALTNPTQDSSGLSVQKFNAENAARLLGNNAKTIFPISSNSERQGGYLLLCNDEPLFIFFDATKKLFATKLDSSGNFAWNPVKTEIGSSKKQKKNYAFTQVYQNEAVAVWQENKDSAVLPYAQDIHCDGSTGVVLPVSLTKFRGILTGRVVNLFWETKTENNNKGFYIGRSADGVNYNNIGFVSSKASGGNSVKVIDYAATDAKPFAANNFYRLEQRDFDGRSSYSNTILIKNSSSFNARMNNVYPNPVSNVLNIYVESPISDKVSFLISDETGKKVYQLNVVISKGSNNIQVNIASLVTGNYFIKLISKNLYENATQHFVKNLMAKY
jgi:hypothetical protein